MPRIRTLKPEHRQHRKVGPLSHLTYRLWVGMILEADDEGRLVCEAEQLRTLIFGYHRKVTPALIEDSLNTLTNIGLLRTYEQNGTRYADFPSWHDHQRINRKTPSKLPSYNDSLPPHGVLIEDSSLIGRDRKGKERKGSEGKGEESEGRETIPPRSAHALSPKLTPEEDAARLHRISMGVTLAKDGRGE